MDFTKTFETITVQTLEGYIKQGQEENLFLDFKEISSPDFGSRDDRKNLAKALSGFANSSGGLIVWGIEARKNGDGVDCACGRREIEGLSLMLSKLNEFTGTFVTPIVDGVTHKAIPTAGDKGFATTLIPESDSGPHMAKAGEDRYYKRSGGSFYKMEHFDLEDMFGRRRRPRLSLTIDVVGSGSAITTGQRTLYSRAVFGIKNTGRGTAKSPYLALQVHPPYQFDRFGVDGNGNEGLPRLHGIGSGEKRYGAPGASDRQRVDGVDRGGAL